ncbi:MAG TPA: LptF/LptG family permease [Gemmatimonadales bacterium]|nr:LptF/LptG family permease [Gemmatimonadales bacterium]
MPIIIIHPVRLLSRYLLRQLVAPFCFALAALTSLMLLNQVAKKFGSLVGKGLPWSVVAEVFVLSLPFILAMTIPMAVLLAVLYAFSHLAADSEVTALRASGVSVPQMLKPVLLWGVLMAALNFAFVDQVLPRSNAELRGLLIDIGRKRPTFELREQVINEVPPSKYFLRAGRIDAATGRLRNVTIYDVNDETTRRVIYADSGVMAYAPGGRDLSLLLYHGSVHQYRTSEADRFQVTRFDRNEIRVRNVFDELERNTADNIRGDREMSSCEMLAIVRDADRDKLHADRDRERLLHRDLRMLLALPPAAADTTVPEPPADYCVWLAHARGALLPPSVAAQQGAGQAPAHAGSPAPLQAGAQAPHVPAVTSVPTPLRATAPPPDRLTPWAEVALAADRWRDADLRADRYMVEVHKKWAISTACISFVLLGIALALRFPRGGMGLVIGGGLAAFSLYYVGLTAGETLADRALLSPLLSMWLPNIILTVVGIIGLALVNRQPGLNRGGDFRELLDAVRWRLRRGRGGTSA